MRKLLIISRPIILLTLIALMNAADLYLTLLCLINFDFEEQNPIAASIIESNINRLIIFKLLMVSLAIAILGLTFFKSKLSRYTCWAMTAIFTALMIYWAIYLNIMLNSIDL